MGRLSTFSRNSVIMFSVVLFHVAALWVLQSGLIGRVLEIIVPAEIISELIEPPSPRPVPPAPVPPAPTPKLSTSSTPRSLAPQAPAPPESAPVLAPSPNAPVLATVPATTAAPSPVPVTVPVHAPPPPVAPAKVDQPSSNAQYLQNPKPPYPAMSKRLGEQGKVVVRVLIGVDGLAQRAEVQQSSGFDRLDQSALTTVLSWRYVPGKRGGVAEAMWFNVPINFVLE